MQAHIAPPPLKERDKRLKRPPENYALPPSMKHPGMRDRACNVCPRREGPQYFYSSFASCLFLASGQKCVRNGCTGLFTYIPEFVRLKPLSNERLEILGQAAVLSHIKRHKRGEKLPLQD